MNLLQQFVDFLLSQKPKRSLLTVKNYKADIGQFVGWFEKEFSRSFDPLIVTLSIFQRYKKTRNLSASSIERHSSSLRKFFSFLLHRGIISDNPFKKRTLSAEALAEADPWMLRNFKSFLYECKKSNLTIKNYISDIKNFFNWLEEASLAKYSWDVADRNLLNKISSSVIHEYKQRLMQAKFSPLTVNRKLSSLRNYLTWAKNQGLIPEYPSCHPEFSSGSPTHRQASAQSDEILNQVQNDKRNYSPFPPARLLQKSLKGIIFLFDNLLILPLASVLQWIEYLSWKATGKKIFKKIVISKSIGRPLIQEDSISNIRKDFYAPLNISTRYLPAHKRVWHYLRHVRPNWYKRYHSYSFTHYLHFAILIILCSVVGFGIYDNFFADAKKENAILGVSTSAPPRILSFQGKLTDSAETPITKETTILFSLYDSENASSAASLWQENNTVQPDSSGIFSVYLGKKTAIPDTLFSQNSKLFLGITVGNSPELRPRQELATVPFAANSEALQGLTPITNTTKVTNVVLALDSSGNLSIADTKAHTFQVIGGSFVLSGKVLSLTTVPGSNSNIELVPNGVGKIDFSKPIQNSTNNNNLASAVGSVEFDDTVAILATTSAQSALYINQNSTGPLISASTSGTAKFVVENDGTGKFTGDLTINGGDVTSTATTFNLLNSTVTTLNLGGAATNFTLGASSGTITIRNENAKIEGNVTLGNAATDTITFTARVAQDSDLLPIGTSGTNDLGSSSLPWDNAYVDNLYSASSGTSGYWQRANGIIAPTNISDDLLLGSTSTSSAKFAFLNVSSGTPVASISGDLTLNSAGILRTTNLQTLTIGDTTTGAIALSPASSTPSLYAANGGNVGIGTVTPSAKFEVAGGQTKIEISTQYSQRLCHSGSDGSSTQNVLLGDCDVSQADIAEYYGSKDRTIEAGDIVAASSGKYVKKSDFSYQGSAIGIVSTAPHDAFGKEFDLDEYSFPVALIGRIPVKVSLENGPIKAGDALTSSSIPGVAMKATKAGQIVGKALEDLELIDESETVGFYDPENKEYRNKANLPPNLPIKPSIIPIAKINTFVNISWYDPEAYLAQSGELIINSTSPNAYSVSNSENKILNNIVGFFEVVSANIKAGLINASEVITQSLVVTSDSVIVNGQNLRDYIVQTVNESSGIISPVVETDHLLTNIISPLASDSAVTVSGKLVISPPSQSDLALEVKGNASFSGQLSSNSITTNDVYTDGLQAGSASISGTLRANNIFAESIEGLDAKVSSYLDLASYSASLSYVPDLIVDRGQFNQGLMVFGGTSLADLSITGTLSIGGTMFATQNSLETLGTDLSLQSLRQGGLSIMAGLVYIDTDGNMKVQGNLSVEGKLAVTGDVVASGSGTFAKLNFSLIAPVLAVSATEVIASSSAGITSIAPYQSEVTIKNTLVTEKSVIYITPVGTPSAQTPFLMRQIPEEPAASGVEGSFTVGVQSPTNHPLDFNWLIVN